MNGHVVANLRKLIDFLVVSLTSNFNGWMNQQEEAYTMTPHRLRRRRRQETFARWINRESSCVRILCTLTICWVELSLVCCCWLLLAKELRFLIMTGKIRDFEVIFDKINAIYYPGETLIGKIYFRIRERIKLSSIKFRINGYARCNW